MNYLIAGAGYVGRRLALQLQASGTVGTVVASQASGAARRAEGLAVAVWDLDTPDSPPPPLRAERLLYLIPPPTRGTEDPRLARWLAQMPAPRRCVYLSTTAVYGDTGGAMVDEDAPTQPRSERGQRRVAAEQQVRAYAQHHNIEWTILRVPGIYGPDRLPLDRLARGEPVLTAADAGLTNRIHVDDLVSALTLLATHPRAAGRIYNVTDGAPSSTSEHFMRVAAIAGLPPPATVPRAEAAGRITPAFLAYLDESRRLDGTRLTRELGFRPRYADPNEGIRASLAAQTGRADKS